MPDTQRQIVSALRLESERRLAVLATSLIFIPNALFVITDRALVADGARLHLLYALRIAQLALWGTGLVLLRRATTRDALRRVIFGLSIGLVVFIVAVSLLRPADNWMPVRTYILLSFGLFVAYPNRFLYQLIPWLLLTAGTVLTLWWRYAGMPGLERFSVASHFVLAGALGFVVANNHRSLERDFDEALERERQAIEERERATTALRSLEGIIPICSYCHEVRTEAGAWEQLDQYVRSRTEADFSHGMCPRCAKKHFPEMPGLGQERAR